MARLPHLVVIDPAVQEAEEECERTIVGDFTGTHRILRPGLDAADARALADAPADGVVIMGAHVSVHDEHAWLRDLAAFMQPILSGQRRVPLLGICFAHQFIAKLAGGTVDYRTPDRAFYTAATRTTLTGSRLLPDRDALDVMAIQRYEVTSAPPGYRVVASRTTCGIDGIEHVSLPIFAFQFHPDGREELAARNDVPAADVSPALRSDGDALLAAFRRVVSDAHAAS